jgi:hypothetical protein
MASNGRSTPKTAAGARVERRRAADLSRLAQALPAMSGRLALAATAHRVGD